MKKIAALLLAVLLVLTLAACGSGSSTKQEIDEAIEEAEKEIEAVEEEVGEAIDQAEQAAEEAVEEATEPEPEAEAEPEPEAEAEPEPEAEAEPEPEPAYVNEEAGLRIVLPEGITEGEDEDFIFYSLDADGNRMIAVQELGDTSWLNSDDPQEAFALMMEGEFSDASVRHAVLGERVRPVLRTKSEGIPMDIFFVCSEDDSQMWCVYFADATGGMEELEKTALPGYLELNDGEDLGSVYVNETFGYAVVFDSSWTMDSAEEMAEKSGIPADLAEADVKERLEASSESYIYEMMARKGNGENVNIVVQDLGIMGLLSEETIAKSTYEEIKDSITEMGFKDGEITYGNVIFADEVHPGLYIHGHVEGVEKELYEIQAIVCSDDGLFSAVTATSFDFDGCMDILDLFQAIG